MDPGEWSPPFRDNLVPGVIEAEDFDYGGEGVAYFYKNGLSQRQEALDKNKADGKGRDYVYRREWVRINETPGSIQNLSGGDWFEYTINVLEEGDYQLESILSTGGSGNFKLYIDGENVLGKQEFMAPEVDNKWNTYIPVVSKAISLTKGTHVFRFGDINGLNLDKFIFTRIGDYGTVEVFDNKVPGKIEAENFVTGGYHFLQGDAGNYKEYRKDKGVAISKEGDVNGKHQIYIGNMSDNDWLTYDFDCTVAGDYTFSTCVATMGQHKYYITVDGVDYGSEANPFMVNTGKNAWQEYQEFQMPDVKIPLTEGKHKLVYHLVHASCNMDYFRLTTDASSGVEEIVIDADTEGLWYTVDGIAHDKPVKGVVNIHNGKRVMVK